MSRQPVSAEGRADAAEYKQELLTRLGLRADASQQDIESAHSGLVEFLELAPGEVKSWATAQTADLDEALALLSGPEADLLPAAQAVSLAKQTQGVSPSAPSAAPHVSDSPATPLALPAAGTPVAPNPLRKRLLMGGVPLLVAAVVAGVYFLGQTPAVPGMDGAPTGQETAAPAAQPKSVPVDKAKVAALTKKITANPKDKASLQSIGDLYFGAADYKNASVWVRKVLVVDPKDKMALISLGAAQFNDGNSAEAKKQWLVAAKLYPNEAEVHYNLGFLYMSQTPPDSKNMQAEWKKVVDIDPSSQLAKTVSAHIKSTAPTAAPSAK
jgi:tetratricopeptide (TPR) repeat protein